MTGATCVVPVVCGRNTLANVASARPLQNECSSVAARRKASFRLATSVHCSPRFVCFSSKMELSCSVQSYDWGVTGSDSLVSKFATCNANFAVVEGKPYAELWMGTHPNGPSILTRTKLPLADHIRKNPTELGASVIKHFGTQLPFLFKVLSVKKALSIQTHPSKEEAEHLHMKFPNVYKDPNHKPEMAIALTEFRALCGFRPLDEIKCYLKTVPEFEKLIETSKMQALQDCSDNDTSGRTVELMRDCFQSLMLCQDDIVKAAVGDLVERLNKGCDDVKQKYNYDLVQKLNEEFPGDVGIFCIYWLNYITLKPGEALYLAPNEPHAYLSGDCVECMANSDNVIRAGLTPKFRDVRTLCRMLSYENRHPADVLFKPSRESECSLLFAPPVKDFALARIAVPANEERALPKRRSAAILLVVEGRGAAQSGAPLRPGTAFYVAADAEFRVTSEEHSLVLFQAFANV